MTTDRRDFVPWKTLAAMATTPEQRRVVALRCAGHAGDADELRGMLVMLGLDEYLPEPE